MKPPQPYRRCVSETFKEMPLAAVQLMEILLSIDPTSRGPADFALKSEVCNFLFFIFYLVVSFFRLRIILMCIFHLLMEAELKIKITLTLLLYIYYS